MYDDIAANLFKALDHDNTGVIDPRDVLDAITDEGILLEDMRVRKTVRAVRGIIRRNRGRGNSHSMIDMPTFASIIKDDIPFLERILTGGLIVPDWSAFVEQLTEVFEETRHVKGGKNADYIPQLGKVNPDFYALSVCTVDGQRFSIGDCEEDFCVQSCSKPIAYAMALEEHGPDTVLNHIGIEPSGQSFNKLWLNAKGRPHNPMLNSGGIMSNSLIKYDQPMAERFEHIVDTWKRLCGHGRVGFNNPVYLSERSTADRNFCLGYMMQEEQAFPESSKMIDALELYFQGCSIEVNCSDFAILAATFAHGGVCPTTAEHVFKPSTVRDTLSLMSTCGMYDFSGEWAFRIGVPAKSGVAGSIIAVVPDFGGFCVWSPPLDAIGNSFKGVEFFKRLVQRFNFHHFDTITAVGAPRADEEREEDAEVETKDFVKTDPRMRQLEVLNHDTTALLYAAASGNLRDIGKLLARGVDLCKPDYDGRSALHLAAAEGQLRTLQYLLNHDVDVNALDRWSRTPLDDALHGRHEEVAEALCSHGGEVGATVAERLGERSPVELRDSQSVSHKLPPSLSAQFSVDSLDQ